MITPVSNDCFNSNRIEGGSKVPLEIKSTCYGTKVVCTAFLELKNKQTQKNPLQISVSNKFIKKKRCYSLHGKVQTKMEHEICGLFTKGTSRFYI